MARERTRSTVRRAILAHVAASLVAGLVVGAVGLAVSARVAEADARHDAESVTRAAGRLVGPLITPAVRTGDPAASAALERVVRERVIDGSLLRVKVWDENGTIIWSDVTGSIGQRFALDEDDLESLREGTVDSAVSDLGKPENVSERTLGQLVEVYAGVHDGSGRPVLFEAYFSVDGIRVKQQVTFRTLGSVIGLSLLVLEALLIPLAVLLARRVERYEQERRALVAMAADASATERRRVAARLHDGVVQSLTGLGFTLSRVADDLAAQPLPGLAEQVRSAQDTVLGDVDELRGLIDTLYASEVAGSDLRASLEAVAADLAASGAPVRADLTEVGELPPPVAGAVLGVGREALRNAVRHAGARAVTVFLVRADGEVRLRVEDDGAGFDPSTARRNGHLGLALMSDAARAAGGLLAVDSEPGRGTRVELVVPASVGTAARAAHGGEGGTGGGW